jgi:hypothetical protein
LQSVTAKLDHGETTMMTDEATLDGARMTPCKGCGLLVPTGEINSVVCAGSTLALLCSDCFCSALNTFGRVMSELHAGTRRLAQFGIMGEKPIDDQSEEEDR